MEVLTGTFQVVNILNNSAIVVHDGTKEMVIIKQGIGFGRKKEEVITLDVEVEKKFEMINAVGKFTNIMNGYQSEVIDAVMLAIDILQQKIDVIIKEEALLAFVDHLAACFGRIQKQMDIENFFYYETQILYPEAYALASEMIHELEAKIAFKIPPTEIAYIALHIQSISGNMPRKLIDKLNVIIYLIEDKLTNDYHITINKESYYYGRFLIHLKLLIKYVYDRNQHVKVDLSDMVETRYPYEYKIALEVKKIIEKELECKLKDDESSYITIHLLNIITY